MGEIPGNINFLMKYTAVNWSEIQERGK